MKRRLDDYAYWILHDHKPIRVKFAEFGDWMMQPFEQTRRVARTLVGDARVSTVFLSVDHNFGGGPPILFATMIFGGDHAEWQDRYSTWDDAIAGHCRVVQALTEGREP